MSCLTSVGATSSIKENQENIDPYSISKLCKPKAIKWSKEVKVSAKEFSFGKMLPGQVGEQEFTVTNPLKSPMEMKIVVECLDPEFDDLDEYVFTLRSTESNNYHHRHRTLFVPYSRASFKVAIKVPNVKEERSIRGGIRLMFGNKGEASNDEIWLPIEVTTRIPQIFCPKTLSIQGTNIIKLSAVRGKKTDYKIPIRNNSEFDVNFNLDILSHDTDALVLPAGNGGFLSNYNSGVIAIAIRAATNTTQKISRKVLVIKIRGSSVIYSIPVVIEII